ncbi:AraC family transcriptional regulator [Aquimarina sp. ERC-38]|uniref:helix-turn-helix domain-containing protein n=1 Tax=Aquimarina sp. ERC-38 TaxID=2949996 RepID=UPI00224729D9|nr:helix-turn-helix domain-containing protein [Aquimarina sp. ERC-38]UZO82315.1 AraC family transcriptional regulator [Aquimarina sp. ERC-38]
MEIIDSGEHLFLAIPKIRMNKHDLKMEQYHLHKAHPEKLQFQIYELNEYRRKSAKKAAIPHSHSYYQIIWFFKEGGTHTVDFKTFNIKKNTILFISKDHIHAFDNNLDVQGWLIHFNEHFFMHNDVDIFLKYNVFSSKEDPCYEIDTKTAQTASGYINIMREELTKKHLFGYEDIIRFSLKSLLIILERINQDANKTHIKFNSHHELIFAQYKNLIEENYQKGLSVAHYAERLHISSKTLTTITKEVIGKSASQLISERIILEAQRLLKFSSLQISEVAFKVGFEDASYFVKYFKRHLGVSPSHYRNQTSV